MSQSAALRVVDNDRDEITVTLDGKEIRGWSYRDETERRVKMLAAREFCEGWFQALGPKTGTFIQSLLDEYSREKQTRRDAEAALRPFATAASVIPADLADQTLLFAHFPSLFGAQIEIRIGDLRSAAALAHKERTAR